jgi:hypothetical protein
MLRPRLILGALVVLAAIQAIAQTAVPEAPKKACVIVSQHHHKFGEDANRWTRHKAFDYVEGDFPSGMKFVSELGDKQVQAIRDTGGKVVVVQQDYKLPDLQDAREQCKVFMAAAVPEPTSK